MAHERKEWNAGAGWFCARVQLNPARSFDSSASIAAVHPIRLRVPRSRRSRRLPRHYSACRGPPHPGLVHSDSERGSGGRIQIPPPVDNPSSQSSGAGRGGGVIDHVRGCDGEEPSCSLGLCARRATQRRRQAAQDTVGSEHVRGAGK